MVYQDFLSQKSYFLSWTNIYNSAYVFLEPNQLFLIVLKTFLGRKIILNIAQVFHEPD